MKVSRKVSRKKKAHIRPYRIAFLGLALLCVALFRWHSAKASSLDRQREQLDAIAELYYDTQSENNQLNTQLSEVGSDDYVERTARREYDYCWYGETVYTVGNLDEILALEERAVVGQE